MIEFRNAKFLSDHGDEVSVHGLRIPHGHPIGIIGKVASGKSSVLYGMMGFGTLQGGSVTYNGECVFTNKRLARQRLALVPRADGLVANLNVFDNLALVQRYNGITEEKIVEEINKISSILGIQKLYDQLPFNLSPEMKKRVSLARALILRPEYLLLDSPTHSVGYLGAREISIILKQYQKKHHVTYIIASDDIPFVMSMTRSIVIVENGKMKFWGLHGLPMHEPLVASLIDQDVFGVKEAMYGKV